MLQDQCIIIQGDSEVNVSSLGSDSIDRRDTRSPYEYVFNSELLPTQKHYIRSVFSCWLWDNIHILIANNWIRVRWPEETDWIYRCSAIATQDFCGFLQISSKHFNVSMSTCTKTFAPHILPNSSLISLFYLCHPLNSFDEAPLNKSRNKKCRFNALFTQL